MTDLPTQLAAIEAMRATLGPAWADDALARLRLVYGATAVDTALAGLRANTAPPGLRQEQTAEGGSSISGSPISSVAGDLRDAALGIGNYVLRDIRIEPGGTLLIGALPADLPPQPQAIQMALAAYLRTLLERYRYLNLVGIGAGGSRQAQVELRAVFINLRTTTTIPELAALVPDAAAEPQSGGRAYRRILPSEQLEQPAGLRQWLDELLDQSERDLLLNPGQAAPTPTSTPANALQRAVARLTSRRAAPTPGSAEPERAEQLEAIWQRLAAPRTALELIRHYRALVLLGDPGSGKTTVLRHLAMGFALARLTAGTAEAVTLEPELAWPGELPIPMLVQLRRFADQSLEREPAGAGPLLEFLQRQLSEDRLEALARHLEQRLEQGGVLLLLDGFDEVADATRRSRVVRAISLFRTRFPASRMVVSSRDYAYREPCVLPAPFVVTRLAPLESAEQNEFILRWYRASLLQGSGLAFEEQAAMAQQRGTELINALERRERLREIAGSPLLLTMIALVHQQRFQLPQQRARLYEECLGLLLEQWERRPGEERSGGLSTVLGLPDDLNRLALVQPIAYGLQERGREEASQEELKDWLHRRFMTLIKCDAQQAEALIERFLDFLEGRSGLLIARDIKNKYAFPHKTFQEYLVARELLYRSKGSDWDELLKQRHSPAWREVIRLVVGHLVASGQPPAARTLVWALLKQDAPATPAADRSLVLAGELLEELAGALEDDGEDLQKKIIQALVELLEQGRLPAGERVEAAFLLGRLGDPRLPAPEQPGYWCPIEAGPFWHGDDRSEPLRQLVLPRPYRIARFPVTNQQYRQFIAAGGYQQRSYWTAAGWKWLQQNKFTQPRLFDDPRYNGATQPVVAVSWYEASAYCAWLSAEGRRAGWLADSQVIRLPSWLEWERAARGTAQQRYPWGPEPPDPQRANYQATGIGRPAPVGCFPAGVASCGAQDMVGNVWEWTASAWQQVTEVEPAKDFTTSQGIVLSSSAYWTEAEQLCCGARSRLNPFNWIGNWSFRMVLSLRSSV